MSREEVIKLDDEGTAAWNSHNPDVLVDQLADEFVWRDTSLPDPLRTKQEVRQDLQDWFTAFPDLHITVTNRVADEHAVAGEVEFTGAHKGPLKAGNSEIPATGKSVVGRGAYFVREENGKVVDSSIYPDVAGLMAQLGMMPS